ncbi:MAG: sce7726 family protein, partial [Sphingomonadaceae bacterium]|nr:sce7726 family protein [Sphingomonadaceae bacterium]
MHKAPALSPRVSSFDQQIINHFLATETLSASARASDAYEGYFLYHAQQASLTASASRLDRHDRDIRVRLHQWLLNKHAHKPGAAIIHEFEIPRPSARVDIALINGRISGYEIKAAADTLSRLGDQATSFSSVFEKMTLVVAIKHLPKAINAIPNWWEIIQTDGIRFRIYRRGKSSPNLSLQDLLHVLTKPELSRLQTHLGIGPKDWSASKGAIITTISA